MTREPDAIEVDPLPIDAKAISATVDLAWGMDLGTSTREDIDTKTGQLIGYISLLRGQPLGEDQNRETARLLRIVEQHLDPSDRPTRNTPAYEAYNFMRDTAVFARSLLSTYEMATKRS